MEWCETPAADLRRIVSKESAAQIHVVFMGQGLQPEALEQRRLKGDYARVVAFRPTGVGQHQTSVHIKFVTYVVQLTLPRYSTILMRIGAAWPSVAKIQIAHCTYQLPHIVTCICIFVVC